VVLVAVFVGLLWLWQPARQVQRHQENLLSAAEGRNWKELSELIADDYSDRWSHDKAAVLEHSRLVLSQFIAVGIESRDIEVTESNGEGIVRERLMLKGSGGPLAEMATERVSALKQPFIFTWRQQSGKPWDWKLIRADQPELEIPEY
jgi:hypothetical protein